MLARLLFVTDLHKRWKDMDSIHGIVSVQHKIQHEIIDFCKNNGVTHVFIAGDWYDRGFHGIGQAYSAMEEDRLLSNCVNGNVYLCIGNHFYLERDENPEMYIIQPCPYMKPKDILQTAERPLFNVVPKVIIGTVQISLFHYDKLNKAYKTQREDGITYHIGVYHDEVCVPAWVREREGFGGVTSVYEMDQLYANVDMAVHGHIHSDIGLTQLELTNGRTIPLYIPGSLGISQNKEAIKHKLVNLPMVDVNDDGTVTTRLVPFSTHLDELSFFKVEKSKARKKLGVNKTVHVGNGELPKNLTVYLQNKGYTDKQLKLVNEAMSERLNITTAIGILSEVI